MKRCAPGLKSWIFSLKKNSTLLFALPCLPVCKLKAVGWGIAIRAKVEQKERVIFLPVAEVIFDAPETALEVRKRYVAKKKEGMDFGDIFMANLVTQAT